MNYQNDQLVVQMLKMKNNKLIKQIQTSLYYMRTSWYSNWKFIIKLIFHKLKEVEIGCQKCHFLISSEETGNRATFPSILALESAESQLQSKSNHLA